MRVIRGVEVAFWVVVAVAFAFFNVRRWLDGEYLRAALPLAALVGVLTVRVVVAYRALRRDAAADTDRPTPRG